MVAIAEILPVGVSAPGASEGRGCAYNSTCQ